jgi:hypothetical protein
MLNLVVRIVAGRLYNIKRPGVKYFIMSKKNSNLAIGITV